MNPIEKIFQFRKYLLILLPIFLLLLSKCTSEKTNDPAPQTAHEIPEPEPQVTENPVTEPPITENPVIEPRVPEPIDLYDFEAHAPWYKYENYPIPKETTVITAFENEYQHFTVENRRTIESTVVFPVDRDWAQVGLLFELGCPEEGTCDHWDRTGSVQLALQPEDHQHGSEYVELLRYITPYRVGMRQYVDITEYLPLLSGKRTITSFIDTWVGPGHSNGDGWTVTLRFVFYPGPHKGADEIVNIWGRRTINVGNNSIGQTIADQSEPVTITNPIQAKRVIAHLRTTGHSFGTTENCAEFCHLRQDLYVNGIRFSFDPWRSDCEYNPVSPQYGTWPYDRNGWCPGAVALPNEIDITRALDLTQGAEAILRFDIRRPDGSVYQNYKNGGLAPYEHVSVVLLYYQ